MIVHRFLKCVATGSKIQLGVEFPGIALDCTTTGKPKQVCLPRVYNETTFVWEQDANHFERGKATAKAYAAYQKLLDQFCSYQCSDAPHFPECKGDPDPGPSYTTCSKETWKAKHKKPKVPVSCFGVGIEEVCSCPLQKTGAHFLGQFPQRRLVATPDSVLPSPHKPNHFVRAHGTGFVLDNRPFFFGGTNAFDAAQVDRYSKQQVADMLTLHARKGAENAAIFLLF